MQRAGELTEIKTFTGKKTLMNAVALVLHSLWLELVVYKRVCYSVARSERSSDLEDGKNPRGFFELGGEGVFLFRWRKIKSRV